MSATFQRKWQIPLRCILLLFWKSRSCGKSCGCTCRITWIITSPSRFARTMLKGEHGSLIVRVQDILYLEYAGNRKVQIHLKQDEKTVYGSITKFLQLLEPFHFISPHKSYIINPRQIQSVCQLGIILTNQDRIPIAQKRQKQIVAQISDYLHQHLKENLR